MPSNNAIDLTAQGVAYYNGTGTFSGIDGSTSGFVYKSNGTGVAPSFQVAAAGTSYNFSLSGILTANPGDGNTHYFSPGFSFTSISTSSLSRIRVYVSQSVTLNNVYGSVRVAGTLGSAQNCTLFVRKNNTTNTNITTTLQLTAIENTFNNTSLGISLVAGDYFAIGFTGPTWTTNPTTVSIALTISD
jgi:hypothetical protein